MDRATRLRPQMLLDQPRPMRRSARLGHLILELHLPYLILLDSMTTSQTDTECLCLDRAVRRGGPGHSVDEIDRMSNEGLLDTSGI